MSLLRDGGQELNTAHKVVRAGLDVQLIDNMSSPELVEEEADLIQNAHVVRGELDSDVTVCGPRPSDRWHDGAIKGQLCVCEGHG